ncbi:MAG: c-type cytochrome [Gaiellaceae bacterium]
MLSTVSLVVAVLSGTNKIALAVVGGLFILFALVSSMVVPRRYPEFPGRGVGWFSTLAVLFLAGTIATVIVFGKETEAPAEAGTATQTAPTTPPTTRSSTGAAPTTATTTAPSTGATGNPTAGKAVFESAGCSGCHTLKDAGATGKVGPNLDDLKPGEATVQHQVEVGGGVMPAFKGQLSAKQIQDVAAYVSSVAGS